MLRAYIQGALQVMMRISKNVASSEYEAIANDVLKDEDNGIWLTGFPEHIQLVWLERFSWIRWVDRLAEQDQLVRPGGEQFAAFYEAWQRLLSQGSVAAVDKSWQVLCQIEACWFAPQARQSFQIEIEAWNCYMEAILEYHRPHLTINTLEDYERMLDRLAGACFQLLPFLQKHHRQNARKFGMVDQFYNNLRDLYEDSCRGVCYFPTALLNHFGMTRQAILDLSCFSHPGYRKLMEFWVGSYLPEMRQRNLALLAETDLHPAWQSLTTWFTHRYRRTEQVMQACDYNFVEFNQQYWSLVQQELQPCDSSDGQRAASQWPQIVENGEAKPCPELDSRLVDSIQL